MVTDFYIRVGAKKCELLFVYNDRLKNISIKFYRIRKTDHYYVVKDRDILYETNVLHVALRYFRNVLFMDVPDGDDILFNSLNS